ncbi:flavin monoamine oxidase family protein [Sphingomonas adhaesiva]|uniref:flavin monoamine oxidase family protein n=1 Tax=Sphingomonas adhaesiva TaxID=28212 RepID=UPI002FFA43C5
MPPALHSIVVIGAGAAGIAAAHHLHAARRSVLLLEASDRIGGRARSFRHGDATLDLGCGWLHSARRNAWTDIARARGFAIATDTARWGEQWRDLGYPPADRQAFAAAWDRWERNARAARDRADQPLSAFVAPDDPWRPMLDAISGFANGAPLDRVSLHDWLAYEDASTDDNWAVREGYGTLVADHARDLDVRRSTPATHIDHRGRTIRVVTPAGTIETAAVIVAVPTTILAEQRLTFDPPLPAKHDAAAALPLGVADKVFLAVDRVDWPANAHLIGNPNRAQTASYRLSPLGHPLVEAFFGGDTAIALEDGDAAAFAIDELVALLGSAWRARLHPVATTRWRHERWIGGSYSHARLGHAPARATLAEPIDGRLFFAGEACHRYDFSTAHGAYETGLAAARALLDA